MIRIVFEEKEKTDDSFELETKQAVSPPLTVKNSSLGDENGWWNWVKVMSTLKSNTHAFKINDATEPIKPQAEINVLALHRKTALN